MKLNFIIIFLAIFCQFLFGTEIIKAGDIYTPTQLYAIFQNDVYNFDATLKFNSESPLKKKVFEDSPEYKKLISKFEDIKQTAAKEGVLVWLPPFEFDMFSGNLDKMPVQEIGNYDLKNSWFLVPISRNYKRNLSTDLVLDPNSIARVHIEGLHFDKFKTFYSEPREIKLPLKLNENAAVKVEGKDGIFLAVKLRIKETRDITYDFLLTEPTDLFDYSKQKILIKKSYKEKMLIADNVSIFFLNEETSQTYSKIFEVRLTGLDEK